MTKVNPKKDIAGWGVDLKKKRKNSTRRRVRSTSSPERQVARVRINRSLEKPRLTPVFGTTRPPQAISGLIRNYTYRKFNEGQLRHWMLLMLADRTDVIETIVRDLIRGRPPRVLREMGIRVIRLSKSHRFALDRS